MPALRVPDLFCVTLTVAAVCAVFSTTQSFAADAAPAPAATTAPNADARYQQDRANCLAGKTTEDQATCLKEAGARLQAARKGDLSTPSLAERVANARKRCDPLNGDDKRACLARADGLGTTTGSVAGGGELHEYREIVPGVPADLPPTAAGPAPASPGH